MTQAFYRSPKAPFEKLLGLEIIKVTQDVAVVRLPFRAELTNPHGSLHGGVIVSLADTAAAVALSTRYEDGIFFTTRFNIRFRNPSTTDAYAEAKITDVKRNVYFIDIKIINDDQKVVATAEANFFVPSNNPAT